MYIIASMKKNEINAINVNLAHLEYVEYPRFCHIIKLGYIASLTCRNLP